MTEHRFDSGYWKTVGADAWVNLQPLMDRLYAPISAAVLDGVSVPPSGRVLDVGCGAGATTLAMAQRLEPEGLCLGVDVSGPLLDLARRRADEAALVNARFRQGDAQTADFDAPFDALISRFGVMFFPDPVAAFENLRGAMKPEAPLSFACWRGPADNPLAALPAEAARPLVSDLPTMPAEGPGRFAFADRDHVADVLTRAGWRDVEIESLDVDTPLSTDEMIEMNLKLGILGSVLPKLPDALRDRVIAALAERVEGLAVDGAVPLTAGCWTVAARA